MVINYLYIFRACVCPPKADSPLIVYTDTVLTKTIALQRFKTIAGRYSQIIESSRDLKLSELSSRNLGYIDELLDLIAFSERFSQLAGK